MIIIFVNNGFLNQNIIEGLHDVVRTYTRTILPHPSVFFLYGEV